MTGAGIQGWCPGRSRPCPRSVIAELIAKCIDFNSDRSRAIERLCRLVEKRSVGMLTYSSAVRGAQALTRLFVQAEQEASQRSAERPAESAGASAGSGAHEDEAPHAVAAAAATKASDARKQVKDKRARTAPAKKKTAKRKPTGRKKTA